MKKMDGASFSCTVAIKISYLISKSFVAFESHGTSHGKKTLTLEICKWSSYFVKRHSCKIIKSKQHGVLFFINHSAMLQYSAKQYIKHRDSKQSL